MLCVVADSAEAFHQRKNIFQTRRNKFPGSPTNGQQSKLLIGCPDKPLSQPHQEIPP